MTTTSFPGYEQFSDELSTLLYTYPPPFIYIHDPEAFKSTCSVVDSILKDTGTPPSSPSSYSSLFSTSGATTTNPFIIHSARIDAISTFTSRLLFETVIHSLAGWEVNWEDGCSNWHSNADAEEDGGGRREGEMDGGESRWNENVDTFIHGLRAVHGYLCRRYGISTSSKVQGKDKEKANQNDSTSNNNYENVRLVIVIEHAERLKETIPELVVPLTRLAEMVSPKVFFFLIINS